MELTQASAQWATRPADECYASLESLHAAAAASKLQSRTATVDTNTLSAVATGNGAVGIKGAKGSIAALTHYAFGLLGMRAGAGAAACDYLRQLPAELAATCLSHGLALAQGASKLLLQRPTPDALVCRGAASDQYTRIWDADITERLLLLQERGPWQPAPAAFDGKRGLYRSDRDLFAFMVDSGRRIFETDPNGGLSRGFFVRNSEVYGTSFGITTFLYQHVCGNHIVWGASNVKDIRIRHVGNADTQAWSELRAELREYADESAAADETRIRTARATSLGATKEEALDRLFGLRIPALSRKRADLALTAAEQHRDWYGDPYTVWGAVQGLTHIARDIEHQDARGELEAAVPKLMELVN